MTDAKLTTTLPDGSGFAADLVERHYGELVDGQAPDQIVAVCILTPVGYGERRTKQARRRHVVYEHLAIEPVKGDVADTVRRILVTARQGRGVQADTLPLDLEHQQERRELLEAIYRWAAENKLDPAVAWFTYYDPAHEKSLDEASYLRLREFALDKRIIEGDDPTLADGAGEPAFSDTPALPGEDSAA